MFYFFFYVFNALKHFSLSLFMTCAFPCPHWKWMWAGCKLMCIEWLYSVHTAVFLSTGDSVLTSSSFWGICWHIQWTIPSLWPPFHRGCSIYLCYCYLFCLGLCRFIELLIFSILALRRKVHPSYFKRYGCTYIFKESAVVFTSNRLERKLPLHFICFTPSKILRC